MRITVVGSGNVATVLSKLCKQKGHTIVELIARNEDAGKALALQLNCNYLNIKDTPNQHVDLVIVSLSDISLPEALGTLNFGNVPVVHTGAAVSIEVLKKASTNYGVLYPLQSLFKKMDTIPPLPFLIEGNNDATSNFIETFAQTLSDNVQVANEQKRVRLHVAAVIVSNFTTHLYSVANKFCIDEGVDFNMLKPLIQETATRIQETPPCDVQTGPAIRKDIVTLDKHLRILSIYPKLRTLYMRMTDAIMND